MKQNLSNLLRNFDLVDVQVRSIARGPHMRLMTALQVADMYHHLDAVEADIRAHAGSYGLDPQAPFTTLRRQLKDLANTTN